MESEEKAFNFWQKWLVYANIFFAIFGIVLALFSDSFLFDIHNHYTKEVFFKGNELTENELHFKKFIYGVCGATIAGFQILIVFIAKFPFKKKEKWAYQAMWSGISVWFITDCCLSFYHGAIHNILLVNLFSFIMMTLPLIFTRKYFK